MKHICPHCSLFFTRKANLERHIKQQHKDTMEIQNTETDAEISEIKPQLSCSTCGRTFIEKDNLNRHIKSIHMKTENPCPKRTMKLTKPQLFCSTCGRTFITKYNLIRHIKSIHMKRENPCPKCWRVFTRKYTLSQHMKTHKDIMEADAQIREKTK